MVRSLTLWQKALILIAVPLLSELALLITFNLLLDRAETDAGRERQAKQIFSATTNILHHFYGAGAALMTFAASRSPAFEQRYEQEIADIPNQLDQLVQLVQNSPDQGARVRRIQLFSQRVLDLLSAYRDSMEENGSGHAFAPTADFKDQLESNEIQLATDFEALKSFAQKIARQAPESEQAARRLVKHCIFAGMAGSIVLAFALAYFFHKATTSRLAVLMDNTRRLVEETPLNPVLPGSDEIAHLDRTFHGMASSLAEVEQLKQDFVSMVSHDLRAPLGSMQSALVLLSSGRLGTLSEKGVTIVKMAEGEAERLINLINQLLDIDKMASGHLVLQKERLPVLSVVEKSINAVRHLADKQGITIEAPATTLDFYVDQDRIVQVIVNLLSNALKFSPPGSTVTISASQSGEWTEVRVKDEGRGVPAHLRETIFERFKQVAKEDATKKGGTGLGLYACRLIMEAHGGKIGVESEEGMGSTFWFRVETIT